MPDPKFKLGDYVTVEFIGRITAIELEKTIKGEELHYTVEGPREYARRLPETEIYPLPTPKQQGS